MLPNQFKKNIKIYPVYQAFKAFFMQHYINKTFIPVAYDQFFLDGDKNG